MRGHDGRRDPAVPVGDAVPIDVTTSHGTVRGRLAGAAGPLAVCLPGIAANHRSFDAVADALAPGCRVAAIDYRGRGASPPTGRGTYGWGAHARDALEVARALGAARVDLVGHSMGAFVAMQAAARAPSSVGRLVLIDTVGAPEGAALRSIMQAGRDMGHRFAFAEAYVARMRAARIIEPWSATWEAALRYEARPAGGAGGGVRLRADRTAVREDAVYSATHDGRRLWPALTMPVLLVRATVPLRPYGGLVVSAVDRDRLAARAPRLEVVEVRANHYGVVAHEAAVQAIRRFLARGPAARAAPPER